ELILFNLITKLPPLRELVIKILYNSILIIINKLMKITYFILVKKASNTEELAYIIIKYVISNYRLLKDIIFNKGNTFIFKF
ncbi:hypothetical protein M431DRAFT_102362, partial [Trichoderma harzianum CBS 226.95]